MRVAMPLVPDKVAFQNSLAGLPLETYQPGETVIVDGSTTGRLLILKKGNVAVVKEDAEIATVADPGAVFGELSVLLDQPHNADVRALETSQFYVANATTLLTENPIAVLYVATVLAQRHNGSMARITRSLNLSTNFNVESRTAWSSKQSVIWRDFSPSAVPPLFKPDNPYDPFVMQWKTKANLTARRGAADCPQHREAAGVAAATEDVGVTVSI
jgi:Cyclic nucleotide-binding domain